MDISNLNKLKLLEKFTVEEIFKLNKDDLIKQGLRASTVDTILQERYRENLSKYEKYLEKNNITMLKYTEKNYPIKLTNIADKPAYIFARGNLSLLYEDNVGIVGSRNYTEYGKKVAFNTAKELSDININTVSGLAHGIDSFAHIGSLKGKYGRTIAVLANGLAINDVYPKENLELFCKIIENGGIVVSEYMAGTKAEKYRFPCRNRIVAGLSDKLLVVEAGNKSGSMITVGLALEQGKDVFAVPRKYLFKIIARYK